MSKRLAFETASDFTCTLKESVAELRRLRRGTRARREFRKAMFLEAAR
jgi:hypothetical protein